VVNIAIKPINDNPQSKSQILETAESQALDITLFAMDKDNDALSLKLLTLPINGQLVCMGYTIDHISESIESKHIVYIPLAGFRGLDSFSYYVYDGIADSQVSDIQIQVGGSNIQTQEDTPICLSEILPLSITITKLPLHGIVTVTEEVVYTPSVNYFGFDSFTYMHEGQEDIFTIYISKVNDAPIINFIEPIDLMEDNPFSITITAIDPESDQLTYHHSAPKHGSISSTAPVYLYYPDENYFGTDSFSVWVSDANETSQVTITLHIQAVNDPPRISDINDIQTLEDTPIGMTLTAIDIDSTSFSYSITVWPEHGSVEIITNQLIYHPTTNYFGSDILTYQAFDGDRFSNEAVIRLQIIGGNDRPVVLSEYKFTEEDQMFHDILIGRDEENDSLSFYIQTPPEHGQINLNRQTGEYTYIPHVDFNGRDGFEYYASDSTLNSESAYITIIISPINDAPTASDSESRTNEDQRSQSYQLLASDSDSVTLTYQIKEYPKKGIISLDEQTGRFTFMPDLNQHGADVFTYIVSDGELTSNIGTVYIQISAINDAPIAKDSSLTLLEDTKKQDYMTATDVDQDTLSYIILTSPEKGTVELLNATQGVYRYVPYANQTGVDMFAFEVTDGYSHSNEANVMITIQAQNDAPTVSNATIHIDEDTPYYYGKLDADDIDGDALTYQIIKNGVKGILTLTHPTTGELVYLPNDNENGQDEIQFRVFDGKLQSNSGILTIIIDPINDSPIAESQDHVISESEATNITLSATDVDNDTISYSLMDQPENGSITGIPPYISYTPKDNFWGIDQFTFIVNDGLSHSEAATIRLNVGVPDVPIITAEDQAVSIREQLSMITSADDFVLRQGPEKGTLNGTAPDLIYIPNLNENGYDAITFFAQNLSETITLQIYIKAINDKPTIIQSERITILEDQSTTITLNATDSEQDSLIYQIDHRPTHGILTELSNHTYLYNPVANYNGPDSFTFSVTDGFATDDSGHIDITIEPVNDSPEAFDQKVDAVEETSVIIQLTGQDIDNDPLTYAIETYPKGGGIQLIGNTVHYISNQNFAGLDQFTFTAIDSQNSQSAPAIIQINVHNTNDIPIAHSTVFSMNQGDTLSGQLSYEEVDNDFLTFSIHQQPEKGILIITNPLNGSFLYMPNFDSDHKTDFFSYYIFDGHAYSNIANVLITIEIETDTSDTPPSLTVRINKDYQTGDIYTISLILPETGEVVYQEDSSKNELPLSAEPGIYRFILIAKNYKPYEYPELLNLSETPVTLDIDLDSSEFDPYYPTLEISHIETSNGFDLRVIKKNIYDIQMAIQTDKGEIPIKESTHNKSLKSTRGTIEEPYYYIWTPEEPITQQTIQSMTDQVTSNTIVFNFYDTMYPSEIITSYTVVCNQYASEIDRESTKSDIQKSFEKQPDSGRVYGEKALYTATGQTTFYPLMGTTLNLTIKDVFGIDQAVDISIPPIPLRYLVLDHTDTITYDQNQDRLTIENPDIHIQSTDLLKAVVTYYTFGGNAIGTGIQLTFEIAEGNYKGTRVLYNPFNNGNRLYQTNEITAPFITIPMMLNPKSELYKHLIHSPDIWLYIEEKGDLQSGFRPEKLVIDPEIQSSNGIIYIQMNHLTAIGLGSGSMPESETNKPEPRCIDCDRSSNCFLEVLFGW
jgi:hypothetical protein